MATAKPGNLSEVRASIHCHLLQVAAHQGSALMRLQLDIVGTEGKTRTPRVTVGTPVVGRRSETQSQNCLGHLKTDSAVKLVCRTGKQVTTTILELLHAFRATTATS